MKSLLTDSELKMLSQAIAEEERRTAGEIRLIIAGRSSLTPHVLPLLWMTFFSFGLLGLWTERHQFILEKPWFLLPSVFVLAGGLAWLLSQVPVVQRWLTRREALDHQVAMRAELEFHREGISGTKGRTGILIFLSLFEHKAIVLADQAIASRLPPETWVNVVSKVLEGPKTGQWASKLTEAVRLCGGLLATHFPAQPGDKNELPNHVLLKP